MKISWCFSARSMLVYKPSLAIGKSANTLSNKRAALLFLLFMFYGPAIQVVGEFRYVEIVVLVLLVFNFSRAVRYLGNLEKLLISLFLLAAMAHVVADLVTNASIEGTIKRTGTYIILAMLIIGLHWLAHGDVARIRWMLAGYCLSYLIVYLAGIETPSRGYLIGPWRLGLGMATTIGVALMIAWQPRLQRIGGLALLAMAGIHWMSEGRSVAAITAVTGMLALSSSLRSSYYPAPFNPWIVIGFIVFSSVGIICLNYGLEIATENKMFPSEMQKKMETQFASRYGLLGGGRPDAFVALYAISKRPFLGHGSTNLDPDVWYFYSELNAEMYAQMNDYERILLHELNKEWVLGTPSHSHLLGAWADAGIIAALCWFAVLGLCIYVFVRVMFWRHCLAPLIVLIAVSTIWDILFSPGPARMDMAFRILILTHAVKLLRTFDLCMTRNLVVQRRHQISQTSDLGCFAKGP